MVNEEIIETLKDSGYSVKENGGKYDIGLEAASADGLDEAKSNFESWCADNGVKFTPNGYKAYVIE